MMRTHFPKEVVRPLVYRFNSINKHGPVCPQAPQHYSIIGSLLEIIATLTGPLEESVKGGLPSTIFVERIRRENQGTTSRVWAIGVGLAGGGFPVGIVGPKAETMARLSNV